MMEPAQFYDSMADAEIDERFFESDDFVFAYAMMLYVKMRSGGISKIASPRSHEACIERLCEFRERSYDCKQMNVAIAVLDSEPMKEYMNEYFDEC